MNNRIKELAEMAGAHNNISKFRGHWLPPPPDHIDLATADLEKFANLIIEECCEVVINSDPSVKMVLSEPYKTILNNIQQHFSI